MNIKHILKNYKKILLYAIVGLFIWFSVTAFYQVHKKLPTGINFAGTIYEISTDEVNFLYDLTYTDLEEEIEHEQVIFDSIFKHIEEAEKYILLDMFLYNSYQAKSTESYRKISDELTSKLIEKKKNIPEIKIDVITDPINVVYGGGISAQLENLKRAGVNVVVSDLRDLRDSNFIYSSIWRTFFQWFGNSTCSGWIKHPFASSEKKVTLRSYLNLFNFKANHRKVFVADSNGEMVSIIASANPHDGSSAHSNVALVIKGNIWQDIYQTEVSVAKMSGGSLSMVGDFSENNGASENMTQVQLLTESKIEKAILNEIKSAAEGDKIKIAQFYMSDRDVVKYLINASKRGVDIEMVLDPNRDAFGYEKNGIPNRQIAHELTKKTDNKVKIRWYSTHGEQFHSKLFILESDEELTAILGSANLTRRNLKNYNLEMDALVSVKKDSDLAKSFLDYFSRIWNNEEGTYTVDYTIFQDESKFKTLIYRIQEGLGLSSF